jgi:squalene-associated FAD-dependent desaturase
MDHAAREHGFVEIGTMPPPHVVVVGGGLAGLAAGVALADHGLRVSLLEKNPRLGGRATSYQLPTGEYIDNCQHVTLRCCTNLEDFYRRAGVLNCIRYYDDLFFADSKGGRAVIHPSRLPAPFHLLLSFAKFRFLSLQGKYSIGRALLQILRTGGAPPDKAMTMLDWLRNQKQPDAAIDRFWRVVLVSALNEDLDRMDAGYAIMVFWKAFLSSRAAFGVGVPQVPLADLYGQCSGAIERNGGEVRARCTVSELCLSGGKAAGVRIEGGGTVTGDYVVLALPFNRLLRILPAEIRGDGAFANLTNLSVSPITSVHMWFDRTVMTEPFLTSVDHTVQWIFNKTGLTAAGGGREGQYLQIVISASHRLSDHSQQDIVDMCTCELRDLLPATIDARLKRAIVIREADATFSPVPGCDRWRPPAVTSIHNLFLAGDWTQTHWPATMESAVRSGYTAAEAILARESLPPRLLQPDLEVTGLVRYLSRVLGLSPIRGRT